MVGYDIHLPAIIKCLDIFMSLKGNEFAKFKSKAQIYAKYLAVLEFADVSGDKKYIMAKESMVGTKLFQDQESFKECYKKVQKAINGGNEVYIYFPISKQRLLKMFAM